MSPQTTPGFIAVGIQSAVLINTTYTQHGLVNIAKKKRGVKSSHIQQFEEVSAHEYTIGKKYGRNARRFSDNRCLVSRRHRRLLKGYDAYCTSQQNRLHYLDLNKIENLCNACNERACNLYVNRK